MKTKLRDLQLSDIIGTSTILDPEKRARAEKLLTEDDIGEEGEQKVFDLKDLCIWELQ